LLLLLFTVVHHRWLLRLQDMLSNCLQGCLVLWVGRFETEGYHPLAGIIMAEELSAAITGGVER